MVSDRHEDLVATLKQLGEDLVASVPDGGGPVAGALDQIEATSPGSRGAVRSRTTVGRGPSGGSMPRRVAVGVGLVLAIVVAVPGPRAAVARFLGVGGVRVVTVSDDPADEVPTFVSDWYDPGEPLPVDRALAQAPGPMLPAGLGVPSGAFAGRPAGAVTLVWASGDDLPDIAPDRSPTGVGLVLTAFPGSTDEPVMVKMVGPSTSLQTVTVGGGTGYWIADFSHTVQVLDPDGQPLPDTLRLAGDSLLWSDGTTTYRLESGLGRAGAVALAERIVP